jgi:hypothetical protein
VTPVNVSAAFDDLVDLHAFYSNLLAPALCEWEKYRRLKRRMEMTGLTQARKAEEAGIAPQCVGLLLRLIRLMKGQEMIKRRPIGFGTELVKREDHLVAGSDSSGPVGSRRAAQIR